VPETLNDAVREACRRRWGDDAADDAVGAFAEWIILNFASATKFDPQEYRRLRQEGGQ
jgi:hypothetical protein